MNEPYWLPRTLEEYRQQLAEDNGPQPDEMVRLQRALDAAEEEVARLQSERAAWRKTADLVEQQRDGYRAERDDALARLAAAEAALERTAALNILADHVEDAWQDEGVNGEGFVFNLNWLLTVARGGELSPYLEDRARAALAGSRERAAEG